MLKLFNKEHVAISALTNLKDYKIEYVLSGEDSLEFSLSIADDNIHLVEEEGYVRNKYNEYVIKAIDPSQNVKRYSCVVNVENIKGKSIANFDASNNSISYTIRLAIAGTGWILADNNISKRRTVRLKNTNALEVLREIRKVFRVDFRYDAINKIIHVYEQFGSDKGVYFSDELNLKSFSIPSDTYDYATRLYPYGKDGLNIASINGGKEYVENFQYSNKVIEHIWKDNRYTDVNSLKTDAEAKLEELSKPKRSYQATITDLAKQSDEYSFLDFFLGDTITLLSKQEKFRDKQRIVKYTQYPNESYKNTCELGNTQLTFEDLQKENEYKNQVVDNITSDNNTVDGSKVDSITTDQITDFEAEVAKITDLTVINAEITNLKAENVTITGKLNAIEGEFGTLKANVGVIDKLTVTHTAQINDLKANSATITQLEAVSGKIGTVEAEVAKINTLLAGNITGENIQAGGITSDKLTIANGFITNAMIANLDVSKINAGDISTNKFKIKSDDGGIEIVGATQQFKDKNNKVRIQMGKDTQGNFNFIIRGEDGTTTLIDHTGVKEKAIANDLIKNNMIASDAVGEKQINYSSFATGFNKDTNTNTIKSTKIMLNNQNQTLEVAFNSLKTQADGTKSLTESHSTTIGVMQGQITTAINNTTITKDGKTILLKDDYNRTVATVDSMKSTIGSHTTTLDQHTGKISGVETRVNTVERDLNSITTRVSSTESKVTTVTEIANSANNKIDGLEIGGRNLFIGGKFNAYTSYNKIQSQLGSEEIIVAWNPSYTGKTFVIGNNNFKPKGIYTISGYLTINDEIPAEKYFTGLICTYGSDLVSNKYDNSTGYFEISQTFNGSSTWIIHAPTTRTGGSSDVVKFTKLKLEKGTKATDWTPAPEDVQTQIDANKTEISTTKNKVSSIETNLSSITSRVSTVENKQTTVDGKVTALETWKKQAEVKITDSAIISTVSSQFYNKSQSESMFTSKSQFTQTINDFTFRFDNKEESNMLTNSAFKNGMFGWEITSDNNGYINQYYKLNADLRSGGMWHVWTNTNGAIVMQKDFVIACEEGQHAFSGYIETVNCNSKVTFKAWDNDTNWNTVAWWTGITNHWGHFRDVVNFTGKAKICRVTIEASRKLPNTEIQFNVSEFKLTKGAVFTSWTPNESELYEGVTKVDREGVKIEHIDGSYSRMNSNEIFQTKEDGTRTISIRLGAIRLYKFGHNKVYMGGISPLRVGSEDKYNVGVFGTHDAHYITLGFANYTGDGQAGAVNSWISCGKHTDDIGIYKPLSSSLEFKSNDSATPHQIFNNSVTGQLNLFGDNGIRLGVRAGKDNYHSMDIIEDNSTNKSRFETWGNWNFNNWVMSNMRTTYSIEPKSQELIDHSRRNKTLNELYGVFSHTEGEIRYSDRAEYCTSTSILEENEYLDRHIVMVEIPQLLAENIELNYHISISKLSFGDYRIIEKNPYYFILESEKPNFRFTFEIVARKIEKAHNFAIVANKGYYSIHVDEKKDYKYEMHSKYALMEDYDIQEELKKETFFTPNKG